MMAGADDRGASAFPHRSVLLDASVEALVRKPDGRYIDGTFGRGGHSRLILGRLGAQGRLLAFDKDPDAIREAEALAAEDARFSWFHGSFAEIALAMARRGWASVDGVLLDLGVSSPQLDDPARGFSFMRDGPLDMRMDPRQSPSAAEWLATAGGAGHRGRDLAIRRGEVFPAYRPVACGTPPGGAHRNHAPARGTGIGSCAQEGAPQTSGDPDVSGDPDLHQSRARRP